MTEEKRIYVVVAETVQTEKGIIIQPCGRIAAQVGHVVSKMRHYMAIKGTKSTGGLGMEFEPVTTIVLAARDSPEMGHILGLLEGCEGFAPYETFHDTNQEVYGDSEVLTAIAVGPATAKNVEGITDYLPLWSHGKSL